MLKKLPSVIKKFLAGTLLLVPLMAGLPAHAAPESRPNIYTSPDDYVALLRAVVNWFFYILTFVAVIMLFYAAFLYITAGDDDEKLKKARKIIIYGIVALMLALLANGVPILIRTIIGA